MIKRVFSVSLMAAAGATIASAQLISKDPDRGPYWHPVSTIGTYVYADSFIAPGNDMVTSLGIWMLNFNSQNGSGGCPFQFEILADNGNQPNGASILTSSAVDPGQTLNSLTLVNEAVTPFAITAGQEYWVALSTVGLSGQGAYQVGAHTQNSEGINDNGTFWYSNDSAGLNFDGKRLTPEMAFQVNGQAVPEPAPFAALGLGAIVLFRRRK